MLPRSEQNYIWINDELYYLEYLERIMKFVAATPNCALVDIGRELHISYETVRRYCHLLVMFRFLNIHMKKHVDRYAYRSNYYELTLGSNWKGSI